MADKQFVSVKCEVKDVFDAKLKPGLLKAMTASVTDAINKEERREIFDHGKKQRRVPAHVHADQFESG